MDWKAEADRRTKEVEMTYKVQMDLRAEIERLKKENEELKKRLSGVGKRD